VGTKLKLAFALDQHASIGIDCVAMCVNDVVCTGAKPLFFLDYVATGALDPRQVAAVVAGIAEGCRQSGAALVGGETAEMPGFYTRGEYDVAGFTVGLVDRSAIIDGSQIQAGDRIIGLASSGVHSNGFSLIRKLFPESDWQQPLGNSTLGKVLLTPTRIYVAAILELIKSLDLHGIAHITGGGFIENIPRALPAQYQAIIKRGSWPEAEIFQLIRQRSELSEAELFNTFNMGIGLVIILPADAVESAIQQLQALDYTAYEIGKIVDQQANQKRLCFE